MPANPLGVALRNRRAGHHTLVWARPNLQAPENFTLTSPAFDHRAPIPENHRGRLFGANISPALDWTQPPVGTVELVLIVQDPDVPFGKPATHALTLGIDPSLSGLMFDRCPGWHHKNIVRPPRKRLLPNAGLAVPIGNAENRRVR